MDATPPIIAVKYHAGMGGWLAYHNGVYLVTADRRSLKTFATEAAALTAAKRAARR